MIRHDHFVMVPMSDQGIYTDLSIGQSLKSAMSLPFDFDDVYVYSHGWWTTAEAAMNEYTTMSIGLAGVFLSLPSITPTSALGIGVHWPSMISEDSNSILNIFQPFSYFNRAKMADHVGQEGGYATLRLVLQTRRDNHLPAPRLHLLGHSFGCKVVCSTLQKIARDSQLLDDVSINLVLLQAATESTDLDVNQPYGAIADLPQVRVLLSVSSEDKALTEAFVRAGRLKLFSASGRALGDVGPSAAFQQRMGGASTVSVDVGFDGGAALGGRLVVADLSPLHRHDDYVAPDLSGHHSDIANTEVYKLIAGFIASGGPSHSPV